MNKKFLFIIDPQNDFIEGGALPVPGGREALQRIVDSGILDEDWDGIIVSLDSHNPGHLGFGEPKTPLRKFILQDTPRPTKWPPHCIIDTHGWEIYEPLQKKLMSLPGVYFLEKGMSNLVDSYSACEDIDPEFPFFVADERRVIDAVSLVQGDNLPGTKIKIYWTGLAEDYCVLESIRGFRERSYADIFCYHTLYTDMTACITKHIDGDEENIVLTSYRP